MPQWVPGPDGSLVYVDEAGQPSDPSGSVAGLYGIGPGPLYDLYNSNPLPAVEDPQPVAEPPVVAQPEPAQPSLPQGTQRVSSSESGFQPSKFAQVDRSAKGLPGAIAKEKQFYDARANEQAGMAATAGAQGREAVTNVAQAEADRIAAEGSEKLLLADLNASFGREEQAANAAAQASAEQSKANFNMALQEYRAARVDPTQIFRDPDGSPSGFAWKAAISSFVSGYLGAKGINAGPIMENLNKSIDRNIDSQLTALNQKGKVAEGFKQLWDMQRAESATDAEARQRVRAFMLTSAQDAAMAELSKYDSKLAQAKGQTAVAEINKELVKTLTDIYKTADANGLNAAGQQIEIWRTKVQAAIAKEGHAIERAKLEASKKPGDISEFIVRDEKGNVIGRADTKEEKIKLGEKIAGADAAQRRLLEIQDRMRKAGSEYKGKGYEAWLNTEGAGLESVYEDLLADIRRSKTGAAASAQEISDLKKILPFNTLTKGLFSGDLATEAVAASYGMRAIDDVRTEAVSRVRPVDAVVAQQYRGGGGAELFGPQRTAQQITAEQRKAVETPAQTEAAKVTAPGSGRAVDDPGGVSAALESAGLTIDTLNSTRGKKGDDRVLSGDDVPDWSVALKNLGDLAAQGDQESINELGRYVEHFSNGLSPGDQQKAVFAQHLLYSATSLQGEPEVRNLSSPGL